MFTKHKEMGSRKGLLDGLQEGWVTNQGPQCWEIGWNQVVLSTRDPSKAQEHHAYTI